MVEDIPAMDNLSQKLLTMPCMYVCYLMGNVAFQTAVLIDTDNCYFLIDCTNSSYKDDQTDRLSRDGLRSKWNW